MTVRQLYDGRHQFWAVYSLYRRSHPPLYAARIAYDITYHGLPF